MISTHTIVYRASYDFSKNFADDIFIEVACQSLLYGYKWVVFTNDSPNLDFKKIKEIFLKNKDIVFIFYWVDKNTEHTLICYDVGDWNELQLQNYFKFRFEGDWMEIFKILNSTSWGEINFNLTALLWNAADQQCVSSLIDAMNLGLVFGLPQNWEGIQKSLDWVEEVKLKDKKLGKNMDKFCAWWDNMEDLDGGRLFTKKFFIWLVGQSNK